MTFGLIFLSPFLQPEKGRRLHILLIFNLNPSLIMNLGFLRLDWPIRTISKSNMALYQKGLNTSNVDGSNSNNPASLYNLNRSTTIFKPTTPRL